MREHSNTGRKHVRIKHCKAMDQEANLNNSQSMDKGNDGFTNKQKNKTRRNKITINQTTS